MPPSFNTSYAPGGGTSLYSNSTTPAGLSGPNYHSPALIRPTISGSDAWSVGRQKSSRSLRDTVQGPSKMSSLTQSPQSATAPLKLIPSHGKLHKRGTSASSIPSPSSPAVENVYGFKRSETPAVTYEEPATLSKSPTQNSAVKIKPYLRKLSTRDNTPTLDLSRPAAENEGLAGLGINDFGSPSFAGNDGAFGYGVRRNPHNRSQSVNSTYSATSGAFKPTQPFVHPMHKTPRPYTPPSGNSFVTAPSPDDEAPDSGISSNIMSDEEFLQRQQAFEPYRARRSTSVSTTPHTVTPLNTNHTGSSSHLGLSASQTNLSIKSSNATATSNTRPRGQTMNSFETYSASASSRASMDKTFPFIRGSKDADNALDSAASRAASIHAARIAYNEKEQAKERKLLSKAQKAEQKQREYMIQKKLKEEKHRRKSSVDEGTRPGRPRTAQEDRTSSSHGRKKSNAGTHDDSTHVLEGKEYANFVPVHNLSLPITGTTASAAGPERRTGEKAAIGLESKKGARGSWWRFMTWLRTRLLRLGRRC
ncbi:MAG: hypothetical protein M1822_009718 [Bathelium mastoideum]|nr:MAG: hypothetical protein M1822_009718 [Bathelium mastoideum]